MAGPEARSTVDRAVEGDPEALAALWRENRRWIAAVLLAHRPRGAELEDLLQEVAVAMVRNLHRLEHPDRFHGWLRGTALNVAAHAGRGDRVRRRWLRRLGDQEPEVEHAPFRRLQDAEESARRLARVRDQLDALPVELREPLLLRSVEGLSQKQVAATLGLSESAVESRLVRARKALRDALAHDEPRVPRAQTR